MDYFILFSDRKGGVGVGVGRSLSLEVKLPRS